VQRYSVLQVELGVLHLELWLRHLERSFQVPWPEAGSV